MRGPKRNHKITKAKSHSFGVGQKVRSERKDWNIIKFSERGHLEVYGQPPSISSPMQAKEPSEAMGRRWTQGHRKKGPSRTPARKMEPPTAKVSESQLSLHTFDQLQIPCISQGIDLSRCHGSQVHSLRGWLILTLSCELQDKA